MNGSARGRTISMVWWKIAVTPVLTYWSYHSIALSHQYDSHCQFLLKCSPFITLSVPPEMYSPYNIVNSSQNTHNKHPTLGARPTNDISIEFEIQWNFVTLLFIIYLVTLLRHMQKFIVISLAHFKLALALQILIEVRIRSNLVSGTGTWPMRYGVRYGVSFMSSVWFLFHLCSWIMCDRPDYTWKHTGLNILGDFIKTTSHCWVNSEWRAWGPFWKGFLRKKNPILVKIHLALIWKIMFNQVTILHMSRQLSCRDTCKFVTALNHINHNYNKENFHKISIMNSWALCEIDPQYTSLWNVIPEWILLKNPELGEWVSWRSGRRWWRQQQWEAQWTER